MPDLSEGECTPSEQVQHYLMRVLRLKHGRIVELFDGNNQTARATISHVTRRSCTLQVDPITFHSIESPFSSHLALGISKGDRFDYAVQKSVELGVSSITPIICERSEVAIDDLESRQAHWQKIAIAACEQSGRNFVPPVHKPVMFAEYLNHARSDLMLVLHHRSEFSLQSNDAITDAIVLIGPEGGLSKDEISAAVDKGFNEWSIGPRVMRTETAPLAALSILQSCFGDFS